LDPPYFLGPAISHRNEAKAQSQSIFLKNEAIFRLQLLRRHEPDTMTLGVGSQDPRSFFHLPQTWMLAVDVIAARRDREGDSIAIIAECGTLDDLVSQARAADNGGVPARVAE
jgi:hypothetical protein